jgi:signal peptide peptidase SppA
MSEVHRVTRFVRTHLWAILPEKMDAICELLDLRAQGVTFTAEEIQARLGAVQPREPQRVETVAVIPLEGVLAQKMTMMTRMSGGTSLEQFIGQVRAAVDDDSVRAVIIDADTPGGTVSGCLEAATALFGLRGKKPIVAVANPLLASAGYWIASQADEIVASPSASVGSIGVFTMHSDYSAMNERLGVKPTYVFNGAYKVEGNQDEPLSDEARAFIQARVDERGEDFIKAVARGRGVSPAKVRAEYGQGRVYFAKQALEVGMIDRIGTLEETIARYVGRRGGVVVTRVEAAAGSPELAAEAPETPAAAGAEAPVLAAADPDPEPAPETAAIVAESAPAAELPAVETASEADEEAALLAAIAQSVD